MSNIVIGKHALESLTTGMYSDPMVIFREYIQNAVDSIDVAIENHIVEKMDTAIEIIINSAEGKISIIDNGMGIDSSIAEKTLISIGNSKKSSNVSRGFRGIGRLAALSYCSKLTFETSIKGEKKGFRLSIDAKKLIERLSIQDEDDVTAEDVISEVYDVELYTEKEKKHYFNVIMEGIDIDSELLDQEKVISYISQNGPVPYHPEQFQWGREIRNRIHAEGYQIPEYSIYVLAFGKKTQLFKTYTDIFLIDKGRNIFDSIQDIDILKFESVDGRLGTVGWLAKTNLLGSVSDRDSKGIRLRKGNILIGDAQTLNTAFKDARFNGWCIGELFVLDPMLIPNARRDNFEKNAAYYLLTEKLQGMAATITKDIRNASIKRNTSTLEEASSIEEKILENVSNGQMAASKKSAVKRELQRTKSILGGAEEESIPENGDIDFDELDMLIDLIQGSTSYKAINTLKISNTEKRTLEKVFNVLIASDYENAENIMDLILKVFS